MNASLRQPLSAQHRACARTKVSPCRVARRCGSSVRQRQSEPCRQQSPWLRTRVHDVSSGSSSGQRRVIAHARSNGNDASGTFPFDPSDYIRVRLMPPPYGPLLNAPDGTHAPGPMLTFYPEADLLPHEKTEVLEVYIGGDTALCLGYLLDPTSPTPHPQRPMPLDLLAQLLDAALAPSPAAPTALLHVAIVAIRDDVYHGRLFLGDPATGRVTLDLDCRFSDACWLAVKFGAPMFVHRTVWREEAHVLRNSQSYQLVHKAENPWAVHNAELESAAHPAPPTPPHAPPGAAVPLPLAPGGYVDTRTHASVLNPEAWEEVQLLKKLLEVAVKEEDYTRAITLRDHPYMQLVSKIKGAVDRNQLEPARELFAELEGRIMEARRRSPSLGGQYDR